MGKINVLSFAVANLIAAGEVVDRPASVIKELMENAIDSGADRIVIEIQNGGVVFMRVSDNGCGMEKEDLSVAVRRHATSKIKEAEDLDGIITLGFRGEALAAIAAVSDLRIISRVKGSDSGAAIEVSGGNIIGVFERGCSEGTSVIVENLFFNVPARRKFLKRDVTETAAVSAAVEKVALSRPDISFQFISDGNIKMETAGDGKLLNTLYSIYGREFAKNLIEVNYSYEGISVSGYIGRSDNVKPNRNAQNFFINGRYVKSKTATAALEQAYCSYISTEKFPVCALNIDINPKAVDVNVHPAKLEVKFSNEKPVFESVYYGVKNALESNITRPNISPEKISRMTYQEYKEAFTPKPISDSNKISSYGNKNEKTVDFILSNVTEKENHIVIPANSLSCDEQITVCKTNTQDIQHNSFVQKLTADDYIADAIKHDLSGPSKDYEDEEDCNDFELDNKVIQNEQTVNSIQNNINSFSNDAVDNIPNEILVDLPKHRIVGEIFNSYVIVELDEKILLIDKHAAHERILFEKLKKSLKELEVQSQLLIVPYDFMLTSDEVLTVLDYKKEIESLGFKFEAEKYTISVSALPDGIDLSAVPEMFMVFADRLKNNTGSAELTRDIIFEKALYQAACKAAIKAGRAYSSEHIEWLVNKMMELPDITFCPHGRPVALEMTKSSLDRQFKRT